LRRTDGSKCFTEYYQAGRESDMVRTNRGRLPTGTQTLSLFPFTHKTTGSADSRRLALGVGLHSTHVCGAPQARLIAFGRQGVTGPGTGTARFDRSGESHVEKPRGDDSLADGSTRGGATGCSRPRDETRPADAGRDGPETEPGQPGSLLWKGSPTVYGGRGRHGTLCSHRGDDLLFIIQTCK